jgi:hypothetical protein
MENGQIGLNHRNVQLLVVVVFRQLNVLVTTQHHYMEANLLNRLSYQVIPIKCRLLSTHYLSLRHHTILNIECFNFIEGTMGILKSIPENNLMDRSNTDTNMEQTLCFWIYVKS